MKVDINLNRNQKVKHDFPETGKNQKSEKTLLEKQVANSFYKHFEFSAISSKFKTGNCRNTLVLAFITFSVNNLRMLHDYHNNPEI